MSALVYMSIPVSLNWDTIVKPILKAFREYRKVWEVSIDLQYWIRSESYTILRQKKSDFFILVTPNNEWNVNIKKLPTGVQKELLEAINMNQPIVLCYRSMSGYNFYDVLINEDNTILVGLPSTSQNLFKNLVKKVESPIVEQDTLIDSKASTADKFDSFIPHLHQQNLLLELQATRKRYSLYESKLIPEHYTMYPLTPEECFEPLDKRLLLLP